MNNIPEDVCGLNMDSYELVDDGHSFEWLGDVTCGWVICIMDLRGD